MNDKPKSKWRWRLLRWGLIALAGLATLAAVAVTEEDWRGKHEWTAYQRAAEARGEHLDLAWIVPPPVPDDQNFFAAPAISDALPAVRPDKTQPATRVANRLDFDLWRGDSARWPTNGGNWQKRTLTDLKQWQTYFRSYSQSPEGRTNGFPIAAAPQAPAEDVLLGLTKFDSAIEALRQASQRPQARLPLAYEKGLEDVTTLMPWLSLEKRWMQVLQLRIIAELEAGKSQAALDDVKLALRLTDTLRDQPFLISHLVRLALMSITTQTIYEGIAGRCWNDAQLADLESALATEDFLADFRTATRGERTCGLAWLEAMRLTREIKSVTGNGDEIVTNSLWWTPSAFFYQSEMAVAQNYDRFILPLADLTNRTISLATYQAGEEHFHEATNHFSPYRILANMSFPSVSKCILKFALAQTHVDLARVACALERYRLTHSAYPETLDALGPEFIPALPHDLINGQPLHYRRTDDGYVLYSIGWNETDDGGRVVLSKNGRIDSEQGDWAWQLPAN